MQAVILAGGRGERLQPLTARLPKPLVPFFDRPLLGLLLDHLAGQGVEEAFVTTGYLGAAITRFASRPRRGIRVHVVQEERALGTAGAVAALAPALHSPFLVVSGDAVLDLDLGGLLAAHRRAAAAATLCTAPAADRLRFGVAVLRDGLVAGFAEKPALEQVAPGMAVNAGCYLLETGALEAAGRHPSPDFGRDVFPSMLEAGARIGAAPALRFWRDIGTPAAYREAQLDALAGDWPWEVPASAQPFHVGSGADLVGPVHLGPGVHIGRGAHIVGPVYLGAGATVGDHAVVVRSVLLPGAEIGTGTRLQDCVVDAHVSVPGGLAFGAALVGAAPARPVRSAVAAAPAPTPAATPAPAVAVLG